MKAEGRKEKIHIEIVTGILGMLVFVMIYGIKVCNPVYTAFISLGGDIQQHYLGWCYYRNSGWHFPIGLMDGVIESELISIIYTDSIPLLAVPFKIISPLLPEQFQYFGLWGLLSAGLIGLWGGEDFKIIFSLLVCNLFIKPLFFAYSCFLSQNVWAHGACGSLGAADRAIYAYQ